MLAGAMKTAPSVGEAMSIGGGGPGCTVIFTGGEMISVPNVPLVRMASARSVHFPTKVLLQVNAKSSLCDPGGPTATPLLTAPNRIIIGSITHPPPGEARNTTSATSAGALEINALISTLAGAVNVEPLVGSVMVICASGGRFEQTLMVTGGETTDC